MSVIPAGALIRNREAPELGSGRVLAELEGGSAQVVFENSEEVREVRIEHTDIVRQPLIPGTRVRVQAGATASEAQIIGVRWPKTPQELCEYVVRLHGVEEVVPESHITPLPPVSHSPLDELGALQWRGPFRFFSRWDMHRMISSWYEDSEGLPSAIGARIEPQLHAVHGMRRVLWGGVGRYFLADEDPQARLYQAGMVYQRMCAADPDLRVLVVAPGRRTHRWQTELELRFGGRRFIRVDATHLAMNPPERWESLAHNQRLVISSGAFQQFGRAIAEIVLEDMWDLVIIDEVHRLEPEDPLYHSLIEASAQFERLLLLGALPGEASSEQWAPILALLHAADPDPDSALSQAWTHEAIDARIADLSPLWEVMARVERAYLASDDGELNTEEASALAAQLEALVSDDDFVAEKLDEIRGADRDALGELSTYLRRNYRLEPQTIRCRRQQLGRYELSWAERSVETLDYTPDPSELALIEHLEHLTPPSPTDPLQMALFALYHRAPAGGPERFFSLLEARLDALGDTAGQVFEDLAVFDLLGLEMSPAEERLFRERVIAGAAPLGDEVAWIVDAMSKVGLWHAEAVDGCARYQALARWIDGRLEEAGQLEQISTAETEDAAGSESFGEDEGLDAEQARRVEAPKTLLVCADGLAARELGAFLDGRLDDPSAVETLHSAMGVDEQNEAVERFQRERGCFLLVTDECGAQGRDLSLADVVIHVEQPWSANQVEARLAQVDTPLRGEQEPLHSVVLLGAAPQERALARLFGEALNLYGEAPGAAAYMLGEVDHQLARALCEGAEQIDEISRRFEPKFQALKAVEGGKSADLAAAGDTPGYLESFDAGDIDLQEDFEYCELLEFIDGIDDSLPVRHWARMLGIQDNASGPSAFDFKWHWSNVRRSLAGFLIEPDDVDFLLPEEQVEMISGTFSRKRALRNENLEFFSPGHRLVDALVEDAMRGSALPTPGFAALAGLSGYHEDQDGRSTIFARRLGPQNRGKVYINVVAAARLDRSVWDGLHMPQGLINRAYRHLWPEALSVPVEIDLKGRRPPSVVSNRELIQRIEASYQGPEADQKIEYEIFIQAIEDAARFRQTLQDAVDLALAHLAVEREGLVDGAVAELSDDVAMEMAFLEAHAARQGAPGAAQAARLLGLYQRLIEGVRGEQLEVDALAIVVAGSPQVLVR